MTVPSRTGSITVYQSITQDPGSETISVPSDAKLCIVAASYWGSDNLNFSTLTLNSVVFTEVVSKDTGGIATGFTTVWRLANPATGSQTFDWAWSGALSEGATIFVIFYTDVDTTSPITGSGSGFYSGTGTAVTGSFSSSTNDLCLCVGYSYSYTGTDCDASAGSQSEISDPAEYNSCDGALGEKSGVSGTTTMSVGGRYPSVCGISIAGTSGTTYEMTSAGIATSTTPDTVALAVARAMTSAGVGASTTPAAVLAVARAMTSAGIGASTTPAITLQSLVEMVSAGIATSTTPDTVALAVARAMTSAGIGVSTTPAAVLAVARAMSAAGVGASTTSAITLAISALAVRLSIALALRQVYGAELDDRQVGGAAMADRQVYGIEID